MIRKNVTLDGASYEVVLGEMSFAVGDFRMLSYRLLRDGAEIFRGDDYEIAKNSRLSERQLLCGLIDHLVSRPGFRNPVQGQFLTRQAPSLRAAL